MSNANTVDLTQDQILRAQALSQSVSLFRVSTGDNDEIVETAQKFYEFLKGETDE